MINVQKNGVTQFTADSFAGTVGDNWNFITNAPPPPQPGRQTTALVTWMTHDPFTRSTDVTLYKNVAGIIVNNAPPLDWPYIPGTQYKWQIPAGKYTAFQINVPAIAPMSTHVVKGASYSGAAPLKLSISTQPGDFSATALKVVEGVTPENGRNIYFRNGPGTNFYVGLSPGGVYYLNVVAMDPSRVQQAGLASS